MLEVHTPSAAAVGKPRHCNLCWCVVSCPAQGCVSADTCSVFIQGYFRNNCLTQRRMYSQTGSIQGDVQPRRMDQRSPTTARDGTCRFLHEQTPLLFRFVFIMQRFATSSAPPHRYGLTLCKISCNEHVTETSFSFFFICKSQLPPHISRNVGPFPGVL
jgi:hypothetical protein